jgi:2-polyprenyl-3-methyl-5-hydroxy-6-metoxy-1,4-benzoquinol methylase
MTQYKYTKEEAYKLYRQDPQGFFDEVIHSEAGDESILINKSWPLFWTKYHYNLVENGIMEMVLKYALPTTGATLLDIGSGTGHWLDFYSIYFQPSELWSIDFAIGALDKLKNKYQSSVKLLQWDISEDIPQALKEVRFDIINAIGVIFHIVDDHKWRMGIKNLSTLLKDRGIFIIGGDFSDTTKERGVMRKTRSLGEWKKLASSLDLNVLEVKRYDWWAGADQGGLTDNLLALGRF